VRELKTLGEEVLTVTSDGIDTITICVSHPWFGRIATVSLDRGQALDFVQALWRAGGDDVADAA
jgi:hypothetical protein